MMMIMMMALSWIFLLDYDDMMRGGRKEGSRERERKWQFGPNSPLTPPPPLSRSVET